MKRVLKLSVNFLILIAMIIPTITSFATESKKETSSDWRNDFKIDGADEALPKDFAEIVDTNAKEIFKKEDKDPRYENYAVGITFNPNHSKMYLYLNDKSYKDGVRSLNIIFKDPRVFETSTFEALLKDSLIVYSKDTGFDLETLKSEILALKENLKRNQDSIRTLVSSNKIETMDIQLVNRNSRSDVYQITLSKKMNPSSMRVSSSLVSAYEEIFGKVSVISASTSSVDSKNNRFELQEVWLYNEKIPVKRNIIKIIGYDKKGLVDIFNDILNNLPNEIKNEKKDIEKYSKEYLDKGYTNFTNDNIAMEFQGGNETMIMLYYYVDKEGNFIRMDSYSSWVDY